MRRFLPALPMMMIGAAAIAQQPPPSAPYEAAPNAQGAPPPMEAPPPPQQGRRASLRERFEAANTTNDGKLTLDQAQAARMMNIARNFSAIDADHKGYITFQDLRTWVAAQRAARMGQQAPGGQMAPPQEAPPEGGPPPQ